MSGQFNQRKKRVNSNNYGPSRPRPMKHQPEKSSMQEGVYTNSCFMHAVTSLIGSKCQVRVRNGKCYDGIFRTVGTQVEVCADAVHLVEGPGLPPRDSLIPTMVFAWPNVVSISITDADPNYAVMAPDSFTDTAISSRHNGRTGERELEMWQSPEDVNDDIEAVALEDINANGWDANAMFETNETKFNIRSQYDPTLEGYTTRLNIEDTEEYKKREKEAERHAKEIQNSASYSDNLDLENGDEEMMFSAVHREGATPVSSSGSVGRYVVPQHRSAQMGTSVAQRPQQLMVQPSTQMDVVRGQREPNLVPSNVEAAPIVPSSGLTHQNVNEVHKDDGERPQPPVPKMTPVSAVTFDNVQEKPKTNLTASVKPDLSKPRSEELQELFDFKKNLNVKLPDAAELKEVKHSAELQQHPQLPLQQPQPLPMQQQMPLQQQMPPQQQLSLQPQQQPQQQQLPLAPQAAPPVASAPTPSQLPPTPVASQQTPIDHHGYEAADEAKDDSKDDLPKKSSLNPTAKEFVPGKVYSASGNVHRNLPSQTPPRPPSTVSSPVLLPFVQPTAATVYHPAIVGPHANMQQQPRNAGVPNKRASVSVAARPDMNPPPQAMTGAPLITQPVMIPGMLQPGITMMPMPQPVIRMIPQHQNVIIDTSQHVFREAFCAVPMGASHQPPHPGTPLGAASHHMIAAGGGLPGTMHTPHGPAGIAVGPPQQTSGAPTPTPMNQYGQPPQPGSTMPLPTTSGTPQPPTPIQMFPGGPGTPALAMSHPQTMHPASLHHINNNPAAAAAAASMIYQTQGVMSFPQFPHQGPGMAYATGPVPGQQPVCVGQTQVAAGQQPLAATPHQPPPALGHSSHVVMHGPPQMVMGPQPQNAYLGMPVPAAMTQTPGIAQHPVAAFHMYNMSGAGQTFHQINQP